MSFTWKNGRQLASFENSSNWIDYTYNADGVRIGKSGTKNITYEVSGTQILSEKNGTNTTYYLYDESGSPVGLTYKGTTYYYRKNLQGDIIAILNSSGTEVVNYSYNAWGRLVSMTGNMELGGNNPFRYRGYYYDTESGLYYLNSRYYDPVTGRFINADGYVSTGQGIVGNNMFAYCGNDPVNKIDNNGHQSQRIYDIANSIITVSKNIITNICNEIKIKNTTGLYLDSLPKTGQPNSKGTLYNPDGTIKQKRWYGPDGVAVRDRDYNHPGNMEFPHDHQWTDGKRGTDHLPPSPEFEFRWEPIVGVGLSSACVIGIIIVAADDITVFGISDDFLFGPLAGGFSGGLTLIMG